MLRASFAALVHSLLLGGCSLLGLYDAPPQDVDGGGAEGEGEPDCARADTCGACLVLHGCAWCHEVGHPGCVPVSAEGSCNADDWHASVCPQCYTAELCDSCTSIGGCGWCGAYSLCEPGDADGPTVSDENCQQTWVSTGCDAVDPCSFNLGCDDCADDMNCGWCRTASGGGGGEMEGYCATEPGDCDPCDWFVAQCSEPEC